MHRRTLPNSFKFAWEGLTYALRTQRNMRIHIIVGSCVIACGVALKLSGLEMAILSTVIVFVIVCELINTAIELSIDFLNGKKHHPLVKMVKDMVAAAVMFAAINAVIVGSIIFLRHIYIAEL